MMKLQPFKHRNILSRRGAMAKNMVTGPCCTVTHGLVGHSSNLMETRPGERNAPNDKKRRVNGSVYAE
jgi:hypothetical protein